MRLWITIALVALLAALLWLTGGQTRADAPPAATNAETTTLRYETYDLTGEAATAGSYAFLSDQGDATSVVATYEGLREGTAQRLLIHKTDAQGTSRAPLYDAIAPGAFFEWRKADDCWVRYRVTEVRPDPPGGAPRKLFAVEWATYAFTGCSGAIAESTAAVIEWGPLPDLGGINLSSPVVHGPYQLVPEGWRGAVQEPRTYPSPGYSVTNPTYTQDLAAARRLPYWRDPALPAGWTFSWATAGDVSGPTYGYWAVFATERGRHGVTIFGYYADYRGHPEDASWLNARGAFATRTIAGRPARIAYSPPGPSHDNLFPVTVWIYDPSTETEYAVLGKVKSLRGSNVDAVVAIARSLFEVANEATAATQGAAGPGESLAPLAEPKPLFEWWAEGRPTSPPLDLKLESSRELCTAGTLTEISWQVSGGVAPYELSIEGAAVDVDADNVRVNCGALTEAEAGDAEAALAAKTVSAVVTDSRGVQRQAALEVARARALPAPTGLGSAPQGSTALFWWDEVSGAGSQSPTFYRYSGAPPQHHRYLLRHQPTGAATWTYKLIDNNIVTLGLPDGERLVSVAAIRHPLEAETPGVLVWSAPTDHANVTPPTNVTITATHDTITVSWDVQRHVPEGHVALLGPNGVLTRGFHSSRSASRESVRFTNLPPGTNFTVRLKIGWFESNLGQITEQIATESAPPGYRPLPAGPQRLQLTATHDSITATWEPPYSGAEPLYYVTVFEERTGRKVARRMVHGGATTWTEYGSFTEVQPGTTYRVTVRHGGIRGGQAEATITTSTRPAGARGRSGSSSAGPFGLWSQTYALDLAGQPPRLTLELESSRELCTAGTLTEVSWTISGGGAPYELSIEGMAVDADADNVRVNCGALTEAEAGDEETALAAKRITGVVADSRGVQRQAALDVARARALPAPTNVRYSSNVGGVIVSWDTVEGAGLQSATTRPSPTSLDTFRLTGAVRTRANQDGAAWTYHIVTRTDFRGWRLGPTSDPHVLSVAAVRHPLELETPAALSWSDELVYASTTAAQNVTLAATHDTVTISWDRQPYARNQQVVVWLFKVDDNDGWRRRLLREEPGVAARHTVTFAHLSSDTDWSVRIEMHYADAAERPDFPRNYTRHAVRTLPAPADWNPAPAGPQNLRYTQTAGVTSILWDEPYPDAEPNWFLTIDGPATGALWAARVYGTSWTLPAYLAVAADTEYRVTVEHRDVVGGSASIRFRTPPARPAGQAESLAPLVEPKPLFEWWVDGRPTSPPLHLELRSSRKLCTAGTLTEISWEISGGVAPYELSVEGVAVDVDAENIRINCGALTEAEAGDAEAALAAKTVSAVVTDSRGVQRQAALEVARARALPAPQNISYAPELGIARTFWDWVEGAGSQSPEILAGGGNTQRDGYLVRYRAAGAGTWIYAEFRIPGRAGAWEIAGPSVHEMQVAAVRHSIEAETPAALRWSETLRYVYATAPANAAVTATATTVTVSWDAQPLAGAGSIILEGPRGVKVGRFVEPTEPGRRSYTFSDVPPETSYEVVIDKSTPTGRASGRVSMSVRTSAAPPSWAALPAGPQNVRAHATLESITVTWEAPHAGASDRYNVEVVEEATNALVDIYWINGPDRSVTLRSVFQRIRPATKYRVRVTHAGIVTSTVELVVTTPVAGSFTPHPSPKPLFEWWVDGRPASPPLDLKLRSSRELCTAGTLTEISWEISGGVAPYQLSIEGATVDVDADNIRINCGALSEAEAGDAEAALAAKTVSAVVTDSRGVQRQATLDVARGRALPAPSPRGTVVQQTSMATNWATIGGAHHGASIGWWLMRWHPAPDSGANWTYVLIKQPRVGDIVIGGFGGLREGSSYAYAVATLRDPIEQMTPDALVWSGELEATTSTTPTDVQATSTHDTITVTWDEQPSVRYVYVEFIRADGVGRYGSATMRRWDATLTDQVTLIDLEPETEYDITVSVDGDVEARLSTAIKATTTAAPTGWRAPPRGAQNLSVTATHDTITVTWDAPVPNTRDRWIVYVSHPSWTKSYARWVSAPLTATLGPFTPETTYSVTVAHLDHHGTDVTTTVTTADAPRHGHYDQPPLIEWWADGRPTSPPLHLELRSSRELCTAGTLTEVSWTISGGVAPYTLSIEGEAVDADADNIRINCGPLPTDPHTGELLAAQPKTFHASVSDSRGVATAASVAVTLTTPPYLAADTALRYETYDSTGGAATSGSYAFLADGAAGAVATYEGLRDGSATQLLIHKTDAQGTSRATLYDAVAAGDLFEWRQSYDCWVRYRVTEVRPDPPGAAPRKQLAVERTSYAFSGCTGAIAADAAVLLAWGALPDLGGPTLAAPLRHGPFQIVPEGWAGPVEDDPFRPWPGNSYANPASTTELAEARQLPHWRDPTLPAGWTLSRASSGDPHLDPPYGYCSWWANDRGYGGVELCGGFYPVQDRPRESSESSGVVVVETRMIAGRPAIVEYSPAGPNHNPYVAVRVLVSDPILDVVYHVRGLDGTLRGDRFDAGIAIARSLFEESN